MFKHRAIPALLGAALLAACGSQEATGVTSAFPGTAPEPRRLTLEGLVTDGPIGGATVTAFFAGQQASTIADVTGRYRLTLELPAGGPDSLVGLEARGAGAQQFVRLIGIAGMFDALRSRAGGDGAVDATEEPGVNVTHLSTANTVLAREAAGTALANLAQYRAALGQIDPNAALHLAGALKLLIDRPGTYALPAGFADTLALAQDATARSRLIQTLREEDAAELVQAEDQTLADPNVVPPLPATGLAPLLYLVDTPGDANAVISYLGAQRFEFDAGGAGRRADRQGRQGISWTVSGNAVVVTLTPALFQQTVTRERQFTVFRDETVERIRLVRTSARTVRARYEGSARVERLNLVSGEFEPATTEALARSVSLRSYVPAEFASVANPAGASLALPVYERSLEAQDEMRNTYELAADVLTFAANGTGQTRLFSRSFTWSLGDGNRTLDLQFSDGVVARYRGLRPVDNLAGVVVAEFDYGADQLAVEQDLAVRVTPDLALTREQVLGAHFQFSPGVEDPEYDPLDELLGFWLEYYVDDTGRQAQDEFLRDESGTIQRDGQGNARREILRSSIPFRWQLDGGTLTNVRTFDNSDFSFDCTEGEPDCVVWDRRVQDALARSAGASSSRVYFLQRRQFAESTEEGIVAGTPTQVSIRFYDVGAFPSAPAKVAAPARERLRD